MTSQQLPVPVPHGEQSLGIRSWQDMFNTARTGPGLLPERSKANLPPFF